MFNFSEAHKALVTRILEGSGDATRAQRRAAFDHAELAESMNTLIHKVIGRAHQVTDEDFVGARNSGLSEDQIFEMVICAAIGQATRQYNTALAALDAATKEG